MGFYIEIRVDPNQLLVDQMFGRIGWEAIEKENDSHQESKGSIYDYFACVLHGLYLIRFHLNNGVKQPLFFIFTRQGHAFYPYLLTGHLDAVNKRKHLFHGNGF